MFFSRNKSRKCLVCIGKGCTFAPALREKHGSKKELKSSFKFKKNLFSRKFGSLKNSITFAAAFRGKDLSVS
jgi:hypothetical protein